MDGEVKFNVDIDKTEYVRIIGGYNSRTHVHDKLGKIGKTFSRLRVDKDEDDMVFVFLIGAERPEVFLGKELEVITEKEYFKGVLHG